MNKLLRAVLEGLTIWCDLVVAAGLLFMLCPAWEIGTAMRSAVRAGRRSEARK